MAKKALKKKTASGSPKRFEHLRLVKKEHIIVSVVAIILIAVLLAQRSGNQLGGNSMNPTATIETEKGTITIELFADKAPISVKNFIEYANNGFYDGTIFHRVIPGFMIQGGGFTSDGAEKQTEAPIKNEAKNSLKNDRGTIAMARTQVVDSATSQFFINVADNAFLNYVDDGNYGYAVFGKVVKGMDVVDKIVAVRTGQRGMYSDWPVETVKIIKVTVE